MSLTPSSFSIPDSLMTVLCESSISYSFVALPFGLQKYHFYALVRPCFMSFHTFTPFIGLPFAKGDRASFPMAVMSLASIVSWFGLMGMAFFLYFFPAASDWHTDGCSVHIPYPSVLSSGISSPMVERPFLTISVSRPPLRLPQ